MGSESPILPPRDAYSEPEIEDSKMKHSPAEMREFNRFSETMDQFHNHFRFEWNELYAAASGTSMEGSDTLAPRLTPRRFLEKALRFLDRLNLHHSLEEQYFFPALATRMPAFRQNLEFLNHHRQIHEGMEKLEEYLKECKTGVRDLRMIEAKELMDTWKDVLWTHLDREVEELRGENMRKYWTLAELRQLHIG